MSELAERDAKDRAERHKRRMAIQDAREAARRSFYGALPQPGWLEDTLTRWGVGRWDGGERMATFTGANRAQRRAKGERAAPRPPTPFRPKHRAKPRKRRMVAPS